MISIFTRYNSFHRNFYPEISDGYTIFALAEEIRGKQIANYLGANYNPRRKPKEGIRIYVKPRVREFPNIRDGDYVDFSDGTFLLDPLKKRPGIKVIAHTTYCFDYLKARIPNELFYIPSQHLNWEKYKRERKEVTTGGYIGRPSPVAKEITDSVARVLREVGMDFYVCFKWMNREDAIDFYRDIDFLVIGGHESIRVNSYVMTPTKMINAASFGIPSIAYFMVGYEEFEGYYVRFDKDEDLLEEVAKLRDREYYKNKAEILLGKAEEYHISNIAEKYRRLT